jgi:hypothetical protein
VGLSGADVWACYAADLGCSAPYAHAVTDEGGTARVQVAPALIGHGLEAGNYLQITLADAGTVPTLSFWGFPVGQQTATLTAVGIASEAFWQRAVTRGGVTWDTSRGIVFFGVGDCTPWAGGIDVEVTLDPSDPLIREFYYSQGIPHFDFDATSTEPPAIQTPLSGGFVNVPAGPVTLTATPRAIGRPTSRATAYARADTVTFVELHPSP